MRGQTSLEYLLLTAGVIVIALAAGYHVVTSVSQTVGSLEGLPSAGTPKTPASQGVPTCSLSISPASPTTTDTITLTLTASDDTALSSASVSLDGSELTSCTLSGTSDTCAHTFGPLSAGTHTLSATVKDKSGLTGSCTLTFTVESPSAALDTTPPDVNVSASPNPAVVGQIVTVTATATDDTSLSSITISVQGVGVQTCSASGRTSTCTYSLDTSSLSADTYTITATAIDTSGNTGSGKVTLTLTSDSPPTVSILSPQDGATFDAPASADVTLSASDDNALSSVALDCGNGQSTTWTPDSNTFSATYTCTYSSTGTYTITVTATDSASQQAQESITVFVQSEGSDTISPVVTILSPADGSVLATGAVDVNFEVLDNNVISSVSLDCDYPGVAEQTYKPDSNHFSSVYTCTYPSDGNYTIYVGAADAAGNQGDDVITIVVDTTAPSVSITVEPPSGSPDTTFTITCTATDAVGLSSVLLSVDGAEVNRCNGSPCTYSGTFPVGTHSATCSAVDLAGNESTESGTFTVSSGGDAPPTATLSVSPDDANESVPVTLSCLGSDDVGVSSIILRLDGAEVNYCTDSTECSYAGYLSGGSHDATCVVTDTAGQTATDYLSFVVDSKPYAGLEVSPTSAYVGGTVTLSCTGIDDRGIAEITIQVPGAEFVHVCDYTADNYPLTARCETTFVPEQAGDYSVFCTVRDTASQAASDENTITVIGTSAAVFAEPKCVGSGSGKYVYVHASGADPNGVRRISIFVPDYGQQVCTPTGAVGTCVMQIDTRDLLGEYTATVSVAGGSGSASAATTFYVDAEPPTVSITSPADGTIVRVPGTVTIGFSATDNCGISRVLIDCDSDGNYEWVLSYHGQTQVSGSAVCAYRESPAIPLVTVRAEDLVGNVGTDTVTLGYQQTASPEDNTPPTLSLSYSVSPGKGAATVAVTCTAEDENGIFRVGVGVDGVQTVCTSSPCSYTATISDAGTHAAVCYAWDNAYNDAAVQKSFAIFHHPTALDGCSESGGVLYCSEPYVIGDVLGPVGCLWYDNTGAMHFSYGRAYVWDTPYVCTSYLSLGLSWAPD